MVTVQNDYNNECGWGHVTCVNWIKEIYFEEQDESYVNDEDVIKID